MLEYCLQRVSASNVWRKQWSIRLTVRLTHIRLNTIHEVWFIRVCRTVKSWSFILVFSFHMWGTELKTCIVMWVVVSSETEANSVVNTLHWTVSLYSVIIVNVNLYFNERDWYSNEIAEIERRQYMSSVLLISSVLLCKYLRVDHLSFDAIQYV